MDFHFIQVPNSKWVGLPSRRFAGGTGRVPPPGRVPISCSSHRRQPLLWICEYSVPYVSSLGHTGGGGRSGPASGASQITPRRQPSLDGRADGRTDGRADVRTDVWDGGGAVGRAVVA